MAFIYVLQDIQGNVKYVGQTSEDIRKRYNTHLKEAHKGNQNKRQGCELTNHTNGGEGCFNPSEELRKKRSEMMKKLWANPEYKQRLKKSLSGHPCSEEKKRKIAEKATGRLHSEETKLRISQYMTGKKRPDLVGHVVTAETRKKMSEKLKGKTAWNKGISPTPETLLKLSLSHKGKTLPEEQKKKISEGLKNSDRYRKVI